MNTTDAGTAHKSILVRRNALLLVGGYFCLAFAAFQISAVFWPPSAIRYLGGPAELSRARPVVYISLCVGIAIVVAILGLYDLSGAGTLRRLPLLRTVVTATTSIFVLRGLLFIPQLPVVMRHPGLMRFALFSLISLGVGVIHLGGVIKLFKQLSRTGSS
jgi:hypothetical protein